MTTTVEYYSIILYTESLILILILPWISLSSASALFHTI